MTNTPSITWLVTHSGGFHADELMSSVVLTRLFPAARIVRSRAAEWITPSANRIIYDVGGAYDAEARIFDHHQRGAPLRDDGQPLSSFGLIWRHFGRVDPRLVRQSIRAACRSGGQWCRQRFGGWSIGGDDLAGFAGNVEARL